MKLLRVYTKPEPKASPSTRREWIEINSCPCRRVSAYRSPSTRREWIEILHQMTIWRNNMSPSTRREWIEMSVVTLAGMVTESPSTRREWIEISFWFPVAHEDEVSLHTEGVD